MAFDNDPIVIRSALRDIIPMRVVQTAWRSG